MDLGLELVAVPVSDVDRAKAFYERAGFHADHRSRVAAVQEFPWFTPRFTQPDAYVRSHC